MTGQIDKCPKCRGSGQGFGDPDRVTGLPEVKCGRCGGLGYMKYIEMGGIPFTQRLRPDKYPEEAAALTKMKVKF